MNTQVFVSHTQRDEEFCDIFDRACARVGIRAFRSEFEKIDLPAWSTIRDAIRKSKALFLLVGKELSRAQALPNFSWSYTQNWIAYEIGVACERNIDVWVVCDNVEINFPVPYLNNYLPRSLRDRNIFNYFIQILDFYAKGANTTFPDSKSVIECCYKNDCKGIYNLNIRLKAGTIITCPQCLRRMEFPKGHPV